MNMADLRRFMNIKGFVSRLKAKQRILLKQSSALSDSGQSALLNKVQIVYEMAQTGEGTDACLEHGCLPMLVHFYSPVPDIKDLERRGVWNRRSGLFGIEFGIARQLEYLSRLGKAFGPECRWPETATSDPRQFFTHNGSFSFGCAAALHCMIRYFRPNRVIEIGSGNSSMVISAALKMNGTEAQGVETSYTIVDPYPGATVAAGLPNLNR
jgi:hypothetical protein